MAINGKSVNRRTFLKAAGVTLALPFLESLGGRAVRSGIALAAEAKAVGANPMRMVCVGNALGFHPPAFFPAKPGRDYDVPSLLEPMAPYPHEIDVVRQAREKTMARGSGRHFEQRNARVANPPAKHTDMTVQRRDAGVLNGLAGREQPLHLIEDVIPEPNDRAVGPVDPKTGDAGGRCHARNRRAVLYKCQELAVDREKRAFPLHARASMARILSDAVSNVRSLGAVSSSGRSSSVARTTS